MSRLGERHRVFIHTNASIRDEVLRIFDSTFAITYALEAIAVFVGILGVSGTLLTLILERRRELTTLRLVGADRRPDPQDGRDRSGHDRRSSARCSGGSQALGLALILIYVINVQSFGWTIQFYVPGLFLLQSSLALFVATARCGAVSGATRGRRAAGGAPRRMMRVRSLLFALLAACSAAAVAAQQHAARGGNAEPGRVLRLPADHASHPEYRIEWWYYTGQSDVHRRPPLRVPADVLPDWRRSIARQSRPDGPCATSSWRTSRSPTSAAGGTGPSRSSAGPGWGGPAHGQTGIACGSTTGVCSCRTAGIA